MTVADQPSPARAADVLEDELDRLTPLARRHVVLSVGLRVREQVAMVGFGRTNRGG